MSGSQDSCLRFCFIQSHCRYNTSCERQQVGTCYCMCRRPMSACTMLYRLVRNDKPAEAHRIQRRIYFLHHLTSSYIPCCTVLCATTSTCYGKGTYYCMRRRSRAVKHKTLVPRTSRVTRMSSHTLDDARQQVTPHTTKGHRGRQRGSTRYTHVLIYMK